MPSLLLFAKGTDEEYVIILEEEPDEVDIEGWTVPDWEHRATVAIEGDVTRFPLEMTLYKR